MAKLFEPKESEFVLATRRRNLSYRHLNELLYPDSLLFSHLFSTTKMENDNNDKADLNLRLSINRKLCPATKAYS